MHPAEGADAVLSRRQDVLESAKKRAVIAVARKLAVTLCALWKTGADYRPLPVMSPPPPPEPLPQAA
jgi:hypothetical protein